MNEDFVYLYLNTEIIRNFPCFQAGHEHSLTANAFLVFLLVAAESAWCADCFAIEDYNKFTNTEEHKETIKNIFNITDRAYDDSLRSLVKNKLLYKVKKDIYIVNSWVCTHGNSESIKKHRQFCYDNDIFYPPHINRKATTDEELKLVQKELSIDACKQKHACVYFNNLKNFSCFSAKFNKKKINITELIIFFMFATTSQFVRYPKALELNNVIHKSTTDITKLADLLQLKTRAIQYAIKNLCTMNLLHKLEGENGKYVINPMISAKGTKERVHIFQSSILQSDYFNHYVNGDIMHINNNIINLKTGEVEEV